jgi:hypothetical protein
LYLGFPGGEANFFGSRSASPQGRNNFTKILQLTVTPEPPLGRVLPCHLCHFSVRLLLLLHLLTYPLTDRLKSFPFFM